MQHAVVWLAWLEVGLDTMHTHRMQGGRHSHAFDRDGYGRSVRETPRVNRRAVGDDPGTSAAGAASGRAAARNGGRGGTEDDRPHRMSSTVAIAELLGTSKPSMLRMRARAPDEPRAALVAFVESTPVVLLLLIAICANAVLIGVESDSRSMEDEVGVSTPEWQAVEYGFTGFFALEMLVKIAAYVEGRVGGGVQRSM